ncbi:MAG: hypothetical protein FWC13_08945 [Oscillospiraceae bacterium]|nr:hypothetical protein [Oscillospiraceae bacterium]
MSFFDSYGAEPGLNIGIPALPDRRVNILFAEFLLLSPLGPAGARGFELFCENTGADLITIPNPYSAMQSSFGAALTHSLTFNTHALYRDYVTVIEVNHFGINVAGMFNRYIWILDYIEGDIFTQPHNIRERYGIGGGAGISPAPITAPLNVRARLTMDNAPAINSFYAANTHFAAELPNGMFEVTSVRHLNNIRHFPMYNYLQTAHIDVSTLAAGGTTDYNFMPIGLRLGAAPLPFMGTYSAVRGNNSQWRIENLRIDTGGEPTITYVGLFTEVRGIYYYGSAVDASVVGVSLFNAEIYAPYAYNVGAIAGRLSGMEQIGAGGQGGVGRISRSNSFSSITGGVGNTGGIVGYISYGGVLSYSFNAGFFNTHAQDNAGASLTNTNTGRGAVVASGGTIGGLVGRNYGEIHTSFNNARVNVENVSLTEPYLLSINPIFTQLAADENAYLGGIAGFNDGSIDRTYATNYVALYVGSSSGGIAGHNTGDGEIERSYFIANGVLGHGRSVTKEYLRGVFGGGFLGGDGFTSGSTYVPGNNLYTHYPYPMISNNMPFADIQEDVSYGILQQWGWEDIDEMHHGDIVVVYFERYDNGEYRFYPSTQILVPNAGALHLRDDAPVHEAGYMIIAVMDYYIPGGPTNLGMFVRPGTIPADENWDEADRMGTGPITFTQADPNNMLFDTDEYYVWFSKLDLGELEDRLGNDLNTTHVPLRFLSTSNTLYAINNHRDSADTEFIEGLMHPLFAGAIFNYTINPNNVREYYIRTPWQLQNIDKVNTAPGNTALTFGQNRDINFYDDRGFSAVTGGDLGDGTSPVYQYPYNAVVRRQFNGIFHGHNYKISRVELTASAAIPNGLFSINNGTIRNLILADSAMTGSAAGQAAGGIAGENRGIIELSSVQYSTAHVGGDGVRLGGFVGANMNDGEIRDVFFLSVASPDYVPISSADGGFVGGIVGYNSGVVTRTLYIAPAPYSAGFEGGNPVTTIFPIVGGGNPTLTQIGLATNFFLTGDRYSLDEGQNWTFEPYNLLSGAPIVRLYGGGMGLPTPADGMEAAHQRHLDMGLLWLQRYGEFSYEVWSQPTTGYVYPIITNMRAPTRWPESVLYVPGQVDRDDWVTAYSPSGRARAPRFDNGDFSELAPDFRINHLFQPNNIAMYIDMDFVTGWNTRPVYCSYFDDGDYGGNQGNPSPRWRLIELLAPVNQNVGFVGQMAFSNHIGYWDQPPNVITSSFRYAELNASIQGTLYQEAETTPGQQFYYSFFHTSRPSAGADIADDRLDFFLSGLTPEMPPIVVNCEQLYERDNVMILVRPAISPRQNRNSPSIPGTIFYQIGLAARGTRINSTGWNPRAWNTVAYGPSNQAAVGGEGAPFDLSLHRGIGYLQLFNNQIVVQNIPHNHTGEGSTPIFLYDVWIGNTLSDVDAPNPTNPMASLPPPPPQVRNGVGITFWSTRELSIGAISDTNIPLHGITRDVFNSGAAEWLAYARTNVIGYWTVEFGWKRFYGAYQVPEGQNRTEFAFQSQTAAPQVGNFLSGVSFNAPAFLSVDSYIRDLSGNDISFVQPGSQLEVVTYVRNWGEIAATNVEIVNQIAPFGEYIYIVPGSVAVTMGTDPTPLGVTADLDIDGELRVTLPASFRLEPGAVLGAGELPDPEEILRISFRINVRETLFADINTSTLWYFFRNQVVVEYREDFGRFGHAGVVLRNASPPIRVDIAPIRLSKTITTPPVSPSTGATVGAGAPFAVNLRVENVLGAAETVYTSGQINELMPRGFEIDRTSVMRSVNGGIFEPLVEGVHFTVHSEGGAYRLIIPNVNLDSIVRGIDFSYNLIYTGIGYGVSFVHTTSNYLFLYGQGDNLLPILLSFENPVVGIRVRILPDAFTVPPHILDITRYASSETLYDGGYEVTPIVVLSDENGISVTTTNIDGFYELVTDYFSAVLVGGNFVVFTPLTDGGGVHIFYYQIMLTATRAGGNVFVLDSPRVRITVTVDNIAGGAAGISDYVNGFDLNGDDDDGTTPPDNGGGAIPDDDNGVPPNGNGNGNGVSANNGDGTPPGNGNGVP